MNQIHPDQATIDDLTLAAAGLIPGPIPGTEGVDLVDEEGAPLVLDPLPSRPGAVALVGHLRDRKATQAALAALPTPTTALPIRAEDPRLDSVLAALGNPTVVEVAPKPSGGLVVFFTGLSGSGKSTIARSLMASYDAEGALYTSLDGDVVRRNLSAGLSFSKADRETNIRRIGWVAAEIARNGGTAICSPIAPFDETRRDVRRMAEEAGGRFLLIHVATPLAECERRDRKGLYAKARAGEIPEFTGISSPYEAPSDAELVINTVDVPVDEAVAQVRALIASETPAAATSTSSASASASAPLKVLFVCTANICRSPFMELTARAMVEAAGASAHPIAFDSAGTLGFDGQEMDADMAANLAGTTPGSFRSKPVTRALLEEADLVLTAEASHRAWILDDHPTMFRKVLSLGQAADAISRLEPGQGRDDVLTHLARHRGPAGAENDVKDPYRRGPEAARVCAADITARLAVVIPALAQA